MNTEDHQLSIGDLADRTGVSRRTVRFYVQRGIIDPPLGRGRGSYYTDHHVQQIHRVRSLQREGLSLERIDQIEEAPTGTPGTGHEQSLWLRIPLAPGVNLEVEAGQGAPSQERISRLASACRTILGFDDPPRNGNLEGDDDEQL